MPYNEDAGGCRNLGGNVVGLGGSVHSAAKSSKKLGEVLKSFSFNRFFCSFFCSGPGSFDPSAHHGPKLSESAGAHPGICQAEPAIPLSLMAAL